MEHKWDDYGTIVGYIKIKRGLLENLYKSRFEGFFFQIYTWWIFHCHVCPRVFLAFSVDMTVMGLNFLAGQMPSLEIPKWSHGGHDHDPFGAGEQGPAKHSSRVETKIQQDDFRRI